MSRRLGASLVVTAALMAALPLFVAGWRAADEAERLAERGRLDLGVLAASQADHILGEAFFEIELFAVTLLGEISDPGACLTASDLRRPFLEQANFSRALFVLDCNGHVIAADPPDEQNRLSGEVTAGLFDAVATATDRYVTDSFIFRDGGHAMGGLGLPLYGRGGDRLGTLVSLIDLEQHFSEELSSPAARLGATGHADLIGHDGAVLTSTLHELSATPGQHPAFYRDVMAAGRPRVERVPHAVERLDGEEQEWHIMAYSPLRSAPWGIAIGASEAETFEVATGQRRTLFRLGIAAAAAIVVGAALTALADRARADF